MERHSQFLRFDEIEIDLAGRRLRRAGEEQPLEPKAFAVLVLMAQQPGRAFTRDEILDAVWGHSHITPGTLNRIITLLRHALGEDAHSPRFLRTVHGVGYRFDAVVEHIGGQATAIESDPGAPRADGLSAPISPAAHGASDIRSTSAPTSLPPSVATNSVPHPMSESPDGTVAQPERRRARTDADANPNAGARRLALLALVVLAASLLWLWKLREVPALVADPAPLVTISAAPAVVFSPVLAVLPLRPLGDARGADFADGLSEELINLLARIDGLRVTSLTSSFQFRDADTALPEIAQRLGATHLLEGSVRQDGEQLRIALRLVEATGGQAIWTETYDREFRDIFAVQDSIARSVGETLQLTLGLPSASAKRDENPELYRRYLVARRSFEVVSRLRDSQVPPAADDLRALVREHPDYPRAWGGLATMVWALSTVPRPGRDALRAEAEAAAATALRLDPDQPDAHAVLAGQACREQRWSDCLGRSRRAVQNAPSDSLWRSWNAHRLATVGYVQDALREQQQAVQLDPLGSAAHTFLGRLLDTSGRHDEALAHLRLGGLPAAHTASYFNAVWRRDFEEARRLAELLEPDVPWRSSQLAAVDALLDATKLPHLLSVIEHSERSLLPEDLREPYNFMRFVLPASQRDYARDIAGLDAVQQAGYASYQWIFWMPGERALRQSPAFQKYVRDSGLLAFWREHGWPDVCRSDGGDGVVCD